MVMAVLSHHELVTLIMMWYTIHPGSDAQADESGLPVRQCQGPWTLDWPVQCLLLERHVHVCQI